MLSPVEAGQVTSTYLLSTDHHHLSWVWTSTVTLKGFYVMGRFCSFLLLKKLRGLQPVAATVLTEVSIHHVVMSF